MEKSEKLKKRFTLLLLLLPVCGMILGGCGRSYSIRVMSGEQYIDECPSKAEEGDTVVITTGNDSAGKLTILVNGSDYGTFTDSDTFDFVMPGHDVEIDVIEAAP